MVLVSKTPACRKEPPQKVCIQVWNTHRRYAHQVLRSKYHLRGDIFEGKLPTIWTLAHIRLKMSYPRVKIPFGLLLNNPII